MGFVAIWPNQLYIIRSLCQTVLKHHATCNLFKPSVVILIQQVE